MNCALKISWLNLVAGLTWLTVKSLWSYLVLLHKLLTSAQLDIVGDIDLLRGSNQMALAEHSGSFHLQLSALRRGSIFGMLRTRS